MGYAETQTLTWPQDESDLMACRHEAETAKHVRTLVRAWGIFGWSNGSPVS